MSFVFGVSPKPRAVFILLTIDVGNMVGKGQTVFTHQQQVPGVVGLRKCATEVLTDALHAFWCEWLRIEGFVRVNAKGACVLIDTKTIDLHGFGRCITRERVSTEVLPDGFGEHAFVLSGSLCQTCQAYE